MERPYDVTDLKSVANRFREMGQRLFQGNLAW